MIGRVGMHRIMGAKALPNYRLRLSFDDGAEGEVDLSDLVGRGIFAAWKDPVQFAKVTIDREAGTVAWPDGIDLCPDTLHHDLTGEPLPGVSSVDVVE